MHIEEARCPDALRANLNFELRVAGSAACLEAKTIKGQSEVERNRKAIADLYGKSAGAGGLRRADRRFAFDGGGRRARSLFPLRAAAGTSRTCWISGILPLSHRP